MDKISFDEKIFYKYCKNFNDSLKNAEEELDSDSSTGTLKDLGKSYSFQLANIGFALGYSAWTFDLSGDIKEKFKNEIISDLKIEDFYSPEEIENIEKSIDKCKSNEELEENKDEEMEMSL